MAPVFLTAPAKLTLDLRITEVLDNGYHLIDAEMVTVDLHDTLWLDPSGSGLTMVGAGADVPMDDDNLVARALVLAERTAEVRLTKRIPSQAGLGGGSADAGAILRWAGFTDLEAAAAIGADIAFCTVGGRGRVTGIGEKVESLPFQARDLTLLTPSVGCPTPVVYKKWDEMTVRLVKTAMTLNRLRSPRFLNSFRSGTDWEKRRVRPRVWRAVAAPGLLRGTTPARITCW